MKFFQKLSNRAVRVIATSAVIAVLAVTVMNFLLIMVYRVGGSDECGWRPREEGKRGFLITDVVEGGVAEKAGIRNGDILLEINGRAFRTPLEAQRLIDSLKLGDVATYTVERDSTIMKTEVTILKQFNVFYLSIFLLGLGFLIVGYIVILTKPHGFTQRLFFLYSIFTMLFFGLVNLGIAPSDPLWQRRLLQVASLLGDFLAPPMFVLFFLYFPVRKKFSDKRWFTIALYALNTVLLATIVLRIISGSPPADNRIAGIAYVSAFILGLCLFIHSYFKRVEPSRRKDLRPILIGGSIGIVTILFPVVVSIINPFIFLQPVRLLPALLITALPISFGYSIFHYRLMDIELVVKRSLIYGAVTALLAAIYLLFVFGIGSLLGVILGSTDNKALSIAAFVVIAFVFDPIKRRVQDSIDKTFYRERYNYQKALLEFSQELPQQMNLDQILHSIVSRISGTMHIEKVAVVLCDEKEGCGCVTQNIPAEYCNFREGPQGLISLLKETKAPLSFALLAEEPDSFVMEASDREKLVSAGVVLAVPMFLQGRLIGTINVGPKLAGKVYSQEDMDLLSTVGSQAALAIENARLHRSEIEKQRMEEELKLAWQIQQGLLPKCSPDIEGLDICGITLPARTVGGDYFDYIQLGPGKLIIVVADVSGKGMSAALYMSKVQGMVQLAAHMYESPRDILINVNRRIFDGIERKSFITMILAKFDIEKREVVICRAGHNKALISAGGRIEQVNAAGIGLGLERGSVFDSTLEEVRRPLGSGGLFLFYTDGLTEAMNADRTEFGEDQMTALAEKGRSSSTAELSASIISAVEDFRGSAEQNDDITMVIVKTQ